MKKIAQIIAGILLTAILGSAIISCASIKNSFPPGQAKKIEGEKNAKDLAPGQNKDKKK